MSPASGPAVAQLKQLIFYHLDNESLDNANFLAGRLHALEPRNADASHMLALTYLRLRRPKAAYECAHKYGANGRHLGCAYVFALACQELSKHYEGVGALEKSKSLWLGRNNWNKHSDTSRRHLPDAAAVHNLLAKLWRGHGDLRKAGECYVEAHKSNPFVWDAFQGLCDIGADVEVANTFRITTDMARSCPPASLGQNVHSDDTPLAGLAGLAGVPAATQANHAPHNVLTPSNDPFNTAVKSTGEWNLQTAGNYLLPKMKSKNIFNNALKSPSQSSWETPTANGAPADDDVEMGDVLPEVAIPFEDAPAAPSRRSKTMQRFGLEPSKDFTRMRGTIRSNTKANSESTECDDQNGRMAPAHKRTLSGHSSAMNSDASSAPRRSNRLFSQITGSKSSSRMPAETTNSAAAKRDGEPRMAKATGARGRGPSTVGRVVSGNRKVMPPAPGEAKEKDVRAPSRSTVALPPVPSLKQMHDYQAMPDTAAMESLLTSFRQLGFAYHALSVYNTASAIESFKALPTAQRETPWVLAQMGKAHYEAADYAAAETCFARMLKLQPSRVEDTEVYSSVLWQLKKPVQLAFLAHQLRDLAFDAPQTWCAVGNAFSLSREHEQAIACFKRATQLDPAFSYAWTLMGHELLTNEEFDAALAAYRKGVGGERRGYGGWYGLGKCYERMGKWEEAERHYRIAASINPSNAVLVVCIGVVSWLVIQACKAGKLTLYQVLERLHHPKAALAQYTHALTLSPHSALARFKKARVLMSLRLHHEALAELLVLKDLAPEEANVFFLLGKCYKGLSDKAASVRAFTTALNLDAKAAQYIKEAMETLDEDDSDQEFDDE